MNQWILITERKPTEADADDRGFVYVTNLVGWVSRRHWKDLQLYENLLAWHPKQKTPSPYIPVSQSQYRPAVMPDDYEEYAEFSDSEAFDGTKHRGQINGFLDGRWHCGGFAFRFCRIPVPATVEEEAKDEIVKDYGGCFLRNDYAIRKDADIEPFEAYSLFRREPYGRVEIFAGSKSWAISKADKEVAKVLEPAPASSPSQPEPDGGLGLEPGWFTRQMEQSRKEFDAMCPKCKELMRSLGSMFSAASVSPEAKSETQPESCITNESPSQLEPTLFDKVRKDILVGDDGYRHYWPSGNGYLTEQNLRDIADELARLNADWDAEIQKIQPPDEPLDNPFASQPEQSSPSVDWSKAPEWAMWWACDQSGFSYFYELKPEAHDKYWLPVTNTQMHRDDLVGDVNPHWRSSLQQRPVPSPATEGCPCALGTIKCNSNCPCSNVMRSGVCQMCDNPRPASPAPIREESHRCDCFKDASEEHLASCPANYKPLAKERYSSLDANGGTLTEDEMKSGWHFCYELDGALVNRWDFSEFCSCMDEPTRDEPVASAPVEAGSQRRAPTKEDLKNGPIKCWVHMYFYEAGRWDESILRRIKNPGEQHPFVTMDDNSIYPHCWDQCEIEPVEPAPSSIDRQECEHATVETVILNDIIEWVSIERQRQRRAYVAHQGIVTTDRQELLQAEKTGVTLGLDLVIKELERRAKVAADIPPEAYTPKIAEPVSPSIDWSTVAIEANWLVWHPRKGWIGFPDEPKVVDCALPYWASHKGYLRDYAFDFPPFPGPWQQSKQQRPAIETAVPNEGLT